MHEEKVVPLPFEDYSTQDESDSSGVESPEVRPPADEASEIELKLARSKALLEFRSRIEDAIFGNYLFGPNKYSGRFQEVEDDLKVDISDGTLGKYLFGPKGFATIQEEEALKNITLWGVPLLPSKGHPGTDIVLTKFLQAKGYRVSEAFRMLRKTLKWRRDYKVDRILGEKFNPEYESMWRTSGVDKEDRPICYHTFKAFKNKELRKNFWRAGESLQQFLRWRIQCVEKEIEMLDFVPGGKSSIIHIIDMSNTPRPAIKEIGWFFRKMVTLLYDHYPGVIYKTFIVNVPLWFLAFHAMNLKQIMQRSTENQKAIFLRSPKVTRTLLKYITPENLLARYGGLKRDNEIDFSSDDKVLELNVRANTVEHIQIPANEAEMTITWDVTVVGSDVTYKEEFVPSDDCSYKVLIRNEMKMRKNSVRNSFYIREPGDIVITIGNGTYKKRKVFYRCKSQPCLPVYTIKK